MISADQARENFGLTRSHLEIIFSKIEEHSYTEDGCAIKFKVENDEGNCVIKIKALKSILESYGYLVFDETKYSNDHWVQSRLYVMWNKKE